MEELTVIYCLYSIPDVSFTNSKQADMCLHSVGGKTGMWECISAQLVFFKHLVACLMISK